MQEDRLALRRTAARELSAEHALRTEIELSARHRERAVVGDVAGRIGRARRIARRSEIDAAVLVAVLPADDADHLIADRRVDRDSDLAARGHGLVNEHSTRRHRDPVHRGEEHVASADIVRLAILIAIAEAKAAGDLRHIGRGKDREAQRPAE